MIKNDPQKKALRRSLIFTSAGLLLLLIFLAVERIFDQSARFDLHNPLIIDVIGFLLLIIATSSTLLLLRRINKRRERAGAQDQSMLAREQPVPNENALALPVVIELTPKNRFLGVFLGLPIAIILLIALIVFALSSSLHSNHNSSIAAVFFVALGIGLLLFFGILFFSLRSRMRYTTSIDEEGITSTYNKMTTRVRWQDVRLFAVVDNKKPKRAKIYELSNGETIVRWMWVPSDIAPFVAIWKPTISNEEYQQKMAAFLAVVAAKTHLPLYDIGATKAKWYM